MGWADRAIRDLLGGKTTTIKPHGGSMKGKVESGSTVTVEPVSPEDIEVGDIVLCKVKGNQYLHLVKAIEGTRFLIGNNKGGTNGWTRTIFGKATKIVPPKQ